MGKSKKMKKILFIIMIFLTIIGCTTKVLADFPEPLYLPGNGMGMTTPWWSTAGMNRGIISKKGGNSKKAELQADDGVLNFEIDNSSGASGSGEGGDTSGGKWVGTVADFEEYVETHASSFSPGEDGVIWYQDLCDNIDVLCTEQGTGITGRGRYIEDYKATGDYWEHDVGLPSGAVEAGLYSTMKTYGRQNAEDLMDKIAAADKVESEYKEYYRTSCKYEATPKKATAAEAFVLSEISPGTIIGKGGNTGEYTDAQFAWWAVTGTGRGNNELSQAAFAFQDYINNAEKGGPTTYKTKSGKVFEGGFPIKYEPEFVNTEEEYQVVFNEKLQQYIIGPFKIDYYDCEPFAYIDNIEVYADNSENPLSKEKYYIAIEEKGKENSLKKIDEKYPSDGENFYIVLDYDEQFKKITNIKVDFKYMNAKGNWTLYRGTYTKVCIQGHIYGAYNPDLYSEICNFTETIRYWLFSGRAIEIKLPINSPPMWIYWKSNDMSDNDIISELGQKVTMGHLGNEYDLNTITSAYTLEGYDWHNIILEGKDCSSVSYPPNENHHGFSLYRKEVEYARHVSIVSRWEELGTDEKRKEFYGEGVTGFDYEKNKYDQSKWILTHKGIPLTSVKRSIPPPLQFKIWKDLEYINMGEHPAQKQAISGGAARWWQHTTIEWNDNISEYGKVKISKKVEGQAKDGDVFEFKLTIKDGNEVVEEEKLQIIYKNGGENTVESRLYEWESGKTPYTYEIEEINIPDGYTLKNIENAKGSLVNGKTIDNVIVTNNIKEYKGNLSILKEIENTKLDVSQYDLIKDKTYKFEVVISGDCKFSYNGTEYTVTEDKPVTLTGIEIQPVLQDASQIDKDAVTWKLENVTWTHGHTAKFDVKELATEIEGTEEVSVLPSSGEFVADKTITVTAINKQLTEKSKIKIIKTLEINERISEEELEKLKFKFKVNVYTDEAHTSRLKDESGNDISEEIITTTMSRTTNDVGEGIWVWTAESKEYTWAYGNNPYFTVEEIDECSMHGTECENDPTCTYKKIIIFNKEKTLDQNNGKTNITVTEKGLEGQFKKDEIVNGVFDILLTNTMTGGYPDKGIIEINKKVKDDLLIGKDYNFIVTVTGTFEYNGNLYKEESVQIVQKIGGDIELIPIATPEEIDKTKTVVIHVDSSKNGKWTSGEFSWYGDAPSYTIDEYLNGETVTEPGTEIIKEICASGVPQKGLLSDDENVDNHKVVAYVENSIDSNAGYIHLIKELENSELCTDEYIKSLKFRFKINILKGTEVIDTEIVTLGDKQRPAQYDEKNDRWYWEYISEKHGWKNGESLKCEVTELTAELPSNIEVVSDATVIKDLIDCGDAKDPTKPETEQTDIATLITITNKVKPETGSILIEKRVTNESIKDKIFKFDVYVSGTFKYKDNLYTGRHLIEEDFEVTSGATGTVNNIEWWGETPTYEVIEKESDISEFVSMENETGMLQSENPVKVVYVNKPKELKSTLKVMKNVIGDGVPDKNNKFEFDIKITKSDGTLLEYTKHLSAGESWTSEPIIWLEGEEKPKYEVTEKNINGFEFDNISIKNDEDGNISGQTASGDLEANTEVIVTATNNIITDYKGDFIVNKYIKQNKLLDKSITDAAKLDEKEFNIDITIKGSFKITIDGIEYNIVDGEHKYTEIISVNKAYKSPTIYWYGNNPPEVIVTEQYKEGEGWEAPEYSNNYDKGIKLINGDTVEGTIINDTGKNEIKLTMDLGGVVWEDEIQDSTGKNTAESDYNGKKDESENVMPGVEVFVYRVIYQNGEEVADTRKLAEAQKDITNSGMKNPTITDENGRWDLKGLQVTGFTQEEKDKGYSFDSGYRVRYDIEFVYDGQTYEPTKILSYKDGNAYKFATPEQYVNPKNINVDSETKNIAEKRMILFSNSSLALDYNRKEVDERIQQVYGRTEIDSIGTTIGSINGNDGERNIYYKANVPSNEDYRVQSILQTKDEFGKTYDLYKTKARTSSAGLNFPVDTSYSLSYLTTEYTIDDGNITIKQVYKALYEHCLNINLGLKKRAEVDIEANKDLYSAKLVIDDKEIDYKFNKLSDIISSNNGKGYNRVDNIGESQIKYELGLYNTDYYYRAELYKENKEIYDSVQQYYKSVAGQNIEDSELEVYLTYKIDLYNGSSTDYLISMNSIDDYSECSLGAPVNTQVEKVVNGQKVVVAYPSYTSISPTPKYSDKEQDVSWTLEESRLKGSDGIYYNKYTTDLSNIKLQSGESKYVYVTYAVTKSTLKEVNDCIALGSKSNIVEIANYTTYYSKNDGNEFAGKIDRDSAPSNINIKNYNDEKYWYEDDSDAAPILEITLIQSNKKIEGIAWEDKAINERAIGNGIREDNEALIGGLTTQLVEKITLPNSDSSMNEYDFIWPTEEPLDCLGGRTLESLTGFDSITETSSENGKVGKYEFTGIPTGTYVVRFLYGNNKNELADEGNKSKSAQSLKEDGNLFADGDVFTSNYDKDSVGETAAVYNGQDYKSTIYQAVDGETIDLTNEFHDLSNEKLKEANVSDARDSEYRRLELIAQSETITQDNSEVMSTANSLEKGHTQLYKDYSMFADTAKLNLDLENKELDGVTIENSSGREILTDSLNIKQEERNYTIEKIDFGLIERPETALILDKEIKRIQLTTNDNKTIFDALYNISYIEGDPQDGDIVIGKLANGKYLIAEVKVDAENSKGIDQLQAINKIETKPTNANHTGTQNFRFINIDAEILQGTTIELTYQISALNIGETDYTSQILYDATQDFDSNVIKTNIKELANQAKEKSKTTSVNMGEYIGSYYYTGNVNSEMIVKSKVRQIVDYVDNDALFTESYEYKLSELRDESLKSSLWKNTSITELTGNGLENERLLSREVIPEFEILDKKNKSYKTEQRNNLILSIDDQRPSGSDLIISNADFEKELAPYYKDEDNISEYKSSIILTVTKTVSSQNDSNDLAYDNLAEIVKMENTVGRRDMSVVLGNAVPKYGEFTEALKERDASATELITFTPPTGIEVEEEMTTQILIMIIAAITIVVGGIVIIKKKVLK